MSKSIQTVAIIFALCVVGMAGYQWYQKNRLFTPTASTDQVLAEAAAVVDRLNADQAKQELQKLIDAAKTTKNLDTDAYKKLVEAIAKRAEDLRRVHDNPLGARPVSSSVASAAPASVPVSAPEPSAPKAQHAARHVPDAATADNSPSPERSTPVEAPPAPSTTPAYDGFFNTSLVLTPHKGYTGWERFPAGNQPFAIHVYGALQLGFETADQRREVGAAGATPEMLTDAKSRLAPVPDSSHLVSPEHKVWAVLARYCDDSGCDTPFAFEQNPWPICVPKGKRVEFRINEFIVSDRWHFAHNALGDLTLKPVRIPAGSCS